MDTSFEKLNRRNVCKDTVLFFLALAVWSLFANNASAQGLSSIEVSEAVNDYRSSREKLIVQDFVELLSIPNVAINLDDMNDNVDHITELLESRGFATRRLQSGGAPYIYAELTNPNATETLLFYAHFDGQPVQVENWANPPFTPTLLDAPLRAGGLSRLIGLLAASIRNGDCMRVLPGMTRCRLSRWCMLSTR